MNENAIVTTFSEDSRAYEALARLKELAAEDQIDLHDVLEHSSRSIGNGETAVLADLDESGPAPVDGAMAEGDDRVKRFARKDVEAEIAGAQEAAHKARVTARKELRHQRREATVEKVQAKLRELRERLR
ncbi:MAG: hypothetical protein QOE11_2276, partial [Solirubrobacteraceae bacterium]|nr:hypothetical protein [Solirubrobacteraceae bacterium]